MDIFPKPKPGETVGDYIARMDMKQVRQLQSYTRIVYDALKQSKDPQAKKLLKKYA